MRVVDASALVTLVAGSDQAARDELGTKLTGHELHVPEQNGAEVLSAIRGLRLGGKISEAIAIQALADYAAMPLRPHRAAPFFPRAWQLRHAMTAYDALYASLAETLDCPLVTCDEKLRPGGHGAEVLVVGHARREALLTRELELGQGPDRICPGSPVLIGTVCPRPGIRRRPAHLPRQRTIPAYGTLRPEKIGETTRPHLR